MKHRWWIVAAAFALYYAGVIDSHMLGAALIVLVILHQAIIRGIISTPKLQQ